MKLTSASAILALLLPILHGSAHHGHYHGHGVITLQLSPGKAQELLGGSSDSGVTRVHVIQEPDLSRVVEPDGKVLQVKEGHKTTDLSSALSAFTSSSILDKILTGIKHIQERLGELSRIYPHPSTHSPVSDKPNNLSQAANPIAHSNVSVIINDASGKAKEIQVTKTEGTSPPQPVIPSGTTIVGKVAAHSDNDSSDLEEPAGAMAERAKTVRTSSLTRSKTVPKKEKKEGSQSSGGESDKGKKSGSDHSGSDKSDAESGSDSDGDKQKKKKHGNA